MSGLDRKQNIVLKRLFCSANRERMTQIAIYSALVFIICLGVPETMFGILRLDLNVELPPALCNGTRAGRHTCR